jgi:hypothetical protein
MINFEQIESRVSELGTQFLSARPYEHIVIDNFCDTAALERLLVAMPDPADGKINLSRDYMFAKNKYEKSAIKELSPEFTALYEDLMSDRFQAFLRKVTGQQVFVDPDFHGGGVHQGGEGSYLDMHVDFNSHPLHRDWFRNLNILIYLNKDWQADYKGQLKLRHKDDPDSTKLVEPLMNRCVIMFTRDYTVHGYDAINFPANTYRRSIAAYAYSMMEEESHQDHRTTVWFPEQGSATKKAIGRHWPTLVKIKNALFGSSTAKNK